MLFKSDFAHTRTDDVLRLQVNLKWMKWHWKWEHQHLPVCHTIHESCNPKECQQTLCFCYQSHFMQQLLMQYGNHVTCLNATNRTTDYSLPLFFLVVKTTINYTTAGVFVWCSLKRQHALARLCLFSRIGVKTTPHNTGWSDCCQAEISAIQDIFPESEITLTFITSKLGKGGWNGKKMVHLQTKKLHSWTISEESQTQILKINVTKPTAL